MTLGSDALDRRKIRPVEALPVEIDGRTMIYLRDPAGYATQGLVLSPPAFFVATLFDGRHSILDIQAAFVRRFGEPLLADTMSELIAGLDRHYYLEGERFASHERDTRDRFAAAPRRRPAHAGTSYDANPDGVQIQLDGFFTAPAGPGTPRGRQPGCPLRGIIAPHIDLRVGGATYAWAYREIAERSDAEVFVLLGTSHAGGAHPFIVTRKPYDTPLGPVPTDAAFIGRLETAYDGELYRDEILHRHEHSLEFQTLFLRHALGAIRPFTIVPILVGSFHHMIEARRPPLEDPAIGGFIDALRRTIATETRPVCLVAGVDFAHVGRKFGDAEGLEPDFLARVEAADRVLLAALERVDGAGFFHAIAAEDDRFRVCGLSPMYTFLETIGAGQGRVLRYDRSDDRETQSAVSFASLAFE